MYDNQGAHIYRGSSCSRKGPPVWPATNSLAGPIPASLPLLSIDPTYHIDGYAIAAFVTHESAFLSRENLWDSTTPFGLNRVDG